MFYCVIVKSRSDYFEVYGWNIWCVMCFFGGNLDNKVG